MMEVEKKPPQGAVDVLGGAVMAQLRRVVLECDAELLARQARAASCPVRAGLLLAQSSLKALQAREIANRLPT